MGPYRNIKAALVVASIAGLAAMGLSGARPAFAAPNMQAAQTHSASTIDNLMARDANTFQDDKALNAACRKMGRDNAVCLCVTHVMKYELSLKQYRAATRLYGTTIQRNAIRKSLQSEGFSMSEIKVAEEMETSLTADPNFSYRCTDAKAYYKTSAN